MRKGVGRTRNFTYLGVLLHASLVAVGAPHYLAKESLANCTRIVAVAASGPDTHHECGTDGQQENAHIECAILKIFWVPPPRM